MGEAPAFMSGIALINIAANKTILSKVVWRFMIITPFQIACFDLLVDHNGSFLL